MRELRESCARRVSWRHGREWTGIKLPVANRIDFGDFDPSSNKIKVMTMHASKSLEFPVVAPPGVGHMPAPREDEAWLFYVAATQRLVLGVGKMGVETGWAYEECNQHDQDGGGREGRSTVVLCDDD